MAKIVLTNAKVTIGGTDVSDCVTAVTVNTSSADVETTTFGAGGVTRVGGLRDDSMTIDFINDFSYVEGLVYPLIGSTTSVVVKPNGTAVGTANPSYTGTVLVTEWTPVAGAVGEMSTASITWPVSGTVTRATS
jgi:hypothetical protein